MSRQEKQWYEIVVNAAHQGSGKEVPTVKYIYAIDAVDAWQRLGGLNGYKRAKTPTIKPMSPEKVSLLERIIPELTHLTLQEAKEKGVHAWRLDSEIDLSDVLTQMLAQQKIDF